MSQTIDIPGLGLTEFPDGLSDAEITSSIKRTLQKKNAIMDSFARGIAEERARKGAMGLPFAEVQPSGQVTQRTLINDPERNQAELAKAFTPLLPETSEEDRMRANLKQMMLAEQVSPTSKEETARDLAEPSQPPNKVLAGTVKGVENLVRGFTSPVGIATLGIGALPRTVQKAVALAFAGQMVAQTPEVARELGTEFGKPEEQRDTQKISQLITEAAGNTAFATLAAKHGVSPEPKPAPFQGPIATGEVLKMPTGAKPLATIGDVLAAKGTPLKSPTEPPSSPVAASAPPKPPQTPPKVESAPKASQNAENTAKELGVKFDGVQDYGVGVKTWGFTRQSDGMSFNVKEGASPEEIKTAYEARSKQFAEQENKGVPPSTTPPESRPIPPNLVSSETVPPPDKTGAVEQKVTPKTAETQSGSVPKAVAKVATQVKKVAQTESPQTAKEVKSELVSRVEKHIVDAPDRPPIFDDLEKDAATVKDLQNRGYNRQSDFTKSAQARARRAGVEALYQKYVGKPFDKNATVTELEKAITETRNSYTSQLPKVEINIPGDGNFKIPNTKQHLSEMLVRAKRLETSSGATKTFTESKPSKAQSQAWMKEAEVKTPEIIGMGGAVPTEFDPKTSGDEGREQYGIAERVRKSRAEAGEGPEVPSGQGTTAPDSIERGRELLASGTNPEQALSNFEKTKRFNADDVAVVRAYGESLWQSARNIERKFGTASNEFKIAQKALFDWDTRSKAMQTEWHREGQAQQGATEIDTGSFIGLARAFFADTGKEFTPKQAETATTIADKVTKAETAVDTAKDNLYKHLDEQIGTSDQPGAKSPVKGKPIAKKPVSVDINEARKAFDGYKKGTPMTPEQVKTLWEHAKRKYLDKGETDFDNIRQGLATDFGLDKNDVTKGLAQPKGAKRLSDEMYQKMSDRRRIVDGAKSWVKNQAYPGWYRFIRNVPRIFFIDKVFGHGTVGMVTHAGLNIFNPPAWKTYWPEFFRQFKLLGVHEAKLFGGPGAGTYHERMMQDLVRDPNFVKAKRAGLANDPFRYTDDYQNAFSAWFHKLGLGGNRGFDALKLFRQARFNQIWNDLPAEMQTPEMATMIADSVNHATGVVKMRFREWSNWTFFAPKLEGSRWAWMVGDPYRAAKTLADWKGATPEERNFAISQVKEKATIAGVYLSLLAMNQGLLAASNSKQKVNFTDPRRGDFLAFKGDGMQFGVISPMIGMVRLFANLVHAAGGKRNRVESLVPRAQEFGEVGEEYARGKLSPFAGFGVDLASQADFQGRPLPYSKDRVPAYLRRQGVGKYTYGEYASEQFTPIPVSEAIREVWKHQGMSDAEINTYLKALATGVVMGGTGARMQEDTHVSK